MDGTKKAELQKLSLLLISTKKQGSLFFTLKGVVQANFDFFDPKPDDFHGVKVLLQTYLDYKLWDLSGFLDLTLGQTHS